jgi:hypothetical protein
MQSQPAAFDTREEAEAHITKMNFEMTVARIKKELGCSGTDAMRLARESAPALYNNLNGTEAPVEKAEGPRDEWNAAVDAVADEAGISKAEAARLVASERPDLRMGKGVTPSSSDLAGMTGPNAMDAAMTAARKQYPAEFTAFQGLGAAGGEQARGRAV